MDTQGMNSFIDHLGLGPRYPKQCIHFLCFHPKSDINNRFPD